MVSSWHPGYLPYEVSDWYGGTKYPLPSFTAVFQKLIFAYVLISLHFLHTLDHFLITPHDNSSHSSKCFHTKLKMVWIILLVRNNEQESSGHALLPRPNAYHNEIAMKLQWRFICKQVFAMSPIDLSSSLILPTLSDFFSKDNWQLYSPPCTSLHLLEFQPNISSSYLFFIPTMNIWANYTIDII